MKQSPKARRFWEDIPYESRMKILNNGFCFQCSGSVNFSAEKMTVKDGMLKIDGACMKCSGNVCRMIENGCWV